MQFDIAASLPKRTCPQDSCRPSLAVVSGLPAIERAYFEADMAKIKSSGKWSNQLFIVDDDIVGEITQWKWYINDNRGEGKRFYVHRRVWCRKTKKLKRIALHRYIAFRKGLLVSWDKKNDLREIDHINHDGLDNRFSNLRIATKAENQRNQRLRGGTSQFKGVDWDKKDGKWRARIKNNENSFHLGLFKNEIEAAQAYDKKARELGWPDSGLNFPKREQSPCV